MVESLDHGDLMTENSNKVTWEWMMLEPKLGLGSAQFGLNYGIKSEGKVSHAQLGKILSTAALAGIDLIDTAHLYGNALTALGQHEKLIKSRNFRIVLKIPRIPGRIDFESIQKLRSIFLSDLKKLKVSYVSILMVHTSADLMRPGSDLLFDFLLNMKYLGLCDYIGVSVYYPYEIERISQRYRIDVCSFPVNIFDQRFNPTLLDRLKDRGIELHARSIFLQGLLLMASDDVPENLKNLIDWQAFDQIGGLSRDRLGYCLNYLWQKEYIDYGVIGVNSNDQLNQIVQSYRSISLPIDFRRYASQSERLINPSLW
jgi:aryl-alcohol dehydrogenase-like predicted oxidoreductase